MHTYHPTFDDLKAFRFGGESAQAYGFTPLVPYEASLVFTQLGLIDQLMHFFQHQHLGDPQYFHIIRARNYAQHCLLSLPTWDELPARHKSHLNKLSYECSCLTVRLYATAVLFPIPSSSGWHIDILSHLRTLQNDLVFLKQPFDAWPLFVWSAYVCGIASYRTCHRSFYVECLRQLVRKANLRTWTQVRSGFDAFLWSDAACGHGAAVLWDELRIDETA